MHPFESVGPEPTGALGADAYAAEADIMRFIAILALCLMLLFSVDQSFNRDAPKPAPQTAPTAEAPARPVDSPSPAFSRAVEPPSTPSAQATVVSTPLASDDSTTSPAAEEVTGMPAASEVPSATSLYFASDVVLLTLLTQRRIEVYRSRDAQWFVVTLSGTRAVDPPEKALYRLRPETVPELLRRTAPADPPDQPVEWAVWLEPAIAGAIETQAAAAAGVDLVIERNGTVRSQPSAARPDRSDPPD